MRIKKGDINAMFTALGAMEYIRTHADIPMEEENLWYEHMKSLKELIGRMIRANAEDQDQ